MQVFAVEFDLRLRGCRSLKEKRAVMRPILDGLERRHRLAVAETDHLDKWQRGGIGIAAVAGSVSQVETEIAAAERFVWSFPEIEVLATSGRWLEED